MVKCIRGHMRTNGRITAATAIKRFRENCDKQGVKVYQVIHCYPVGDGVFSIVANVEDNDNA